MQQCAYSSVVFGRPSYSSVDMRLTKFDDWQTSRICAISVRRTSSSTLSPHSSLFTAYIHGTISSIHRQAYLIMSDIVRRRCAENNRNLPGTQQNGHKNKSIRDFSPKLSPVQLRNTEHKGSVKAQIAGLWNEMACLQNKLQEQKDCDPDKTVLETSYWTKVSVIWREWVTADFLVAYHSHAWVCLW